MHRSLSPICSAMPSQASAIFAYEKNEFLSNICCLEKMFLGNMEIEIFVIEEKSLFSQASLVD